MSSIKSAVTSAALAVLVALGAARESAAQAIRWVTPVQAKKEMEKEKRPAIFFFEGPGDPLNVKYNLCFQYPEVSGEMRRYVCAKVGGAGGGSTGFTWNDTNAAKEYGVGTSSTLVFVSFDGVVMDTVTTPVDYKDLAIRLSQLADANAERAHKTKESINDLDQVDKWIESKKYADAVRRTLMVVDRGDKIDARIQKRAGDTKDKLVKLCQDKIAEAKPLADDPTKKSEAKAALKDILKEFGKLDEAKEAQEMLKKLESGS